MVKGTTASGFDFRLDDDVMDNMELVDALADLEDGNTLAMSRICRLILGKDQRKKLYDHLRAENGRVPNEKVESELMEIINFFQTARNS